MPHIENKTLDIWHIIHKFWGQNKSLILGSIGSSMVSHGIYTLLVPRLLAEIFNSGDNETMKRNIMCFLMAFGSEKLFYMYSNYLSIMIEPALTKFLTEEFSKAVFEQYEATSKPVEVAVVIERINTIRCALEDLLYYMCFKLIPLILVLIITVVSIFKLNVKLGLCVLVCIILMGVVLRFLPQTLSADKDQDRLNAHLEDTFTNIEFISSSECGPRHALTDVNAHSRKLARLKRRVVQRSAGNQLTGYIFSGIFYAISIYYLFRLYTQGEIKLKSFEAHILILGKLFDIVFDISYYMPINLRNWVLVKSSNDFVKKLFAHSGREYPEIEIETYDIEFDNVSFAFECNTILDQFSTTIRTGEMVTLYGPSGSGKTTFTNLILKIVSPDDGCVTFGGFNLESLNPRLLRKSIAVVRQNVTSLLCDSVYANIIHGYPDCLDLNLRVRGLCAQYGIERIFSNRDFLEIEVAKAGSNLSGGQKQIIHLLHAAINDNAKVLILDEPTSALDAETKTVVLNLILHLHSLGKTVIIITHDPSIRSVSPRVLTFSRGSNPSEV